MFGFLKTRSEITDEDAMSRYQEGDVLSFELLLERYNRGIFSFMLRMVYGNNAVAEDLLQEVFIKIIENRSAYNSSRLFRSWIYSIARNHVIDYLRKEKFRRHDSLDQSIGDEYMNVTKLDQVKSDERGQEELIYDHQTRNTLYEKLDEIKEEYRVVFVLREIEGFKFEEIAEITETNTNTVKSRHRYAFRELREKLLETGYFNERKNAGEK